MAPHPLTIAKAEARRFLLSYHFLYPPRSLEGRPGLEAVMERLRSIQVDPLDVAGKNVDLVLQSRIDDYTPTLLEEALYGERRYIEAWDKLRSVVPREDWHGLSAFRERMKARYRENKNPREEVIDYVREEIAKRGELTSLDLEDQGETDWRWAPARAVRAALEIMFDWGEIGIAGRVGSRKIYAPIERLFDGASADAVPQGAASSAGAPHSAPADAVPQGAASPASVPRSAAGEGPSAAARREPTPNGVSREEREAYLRWHIRRRVSAVGLIAARGADSWLGVDRLTAAERNHHLTELEHRGEILPVEVEGLRYRCYLPAAAEPLLGEIRGGHDAAPAASRAGAGESARVATIAPLDNLLWDRRLIEDLFGFTYRWEVYKPAAEREYGYYVLPIIQGDRFIGRWEPRRGGDTLEIRGWWWEPGVEPTAEMIAASREMIRRFAGFLGVAPPTNKAIEAAF